MYDLEHDPGELNNVYSERSATAAALGQRLAALAPGQSWADVRTGALRTAPREVRERVAALGYVSGAPTKAPEGGALRDAKDFVGQNWSPDLHIEKQARLQNR